MAFNYTALQALADKLIVQFGQSGQLIRGDSDDRVVRVVEISYRPSERDGQLIAATDRRFLISARGLTQPPDKEEDKLIVGGLEFRIVAVSPLSPAGIPVYYETQVRL